MATITKDFTKRIQKCLTTLGFNPGPIDGAWGPKTKAAVEQFQRANKLVPDGIVGPLTLAALDQAMRDAGEGPLPPAVAVPPWFGEATRLLGTREKPGPGSNPVILDWADDLDLWYPGDDVAWCGLFWAHCLTVGAPQDSLPTNPLGARNFLKYGRECEPILGATLVFWRTHKTKSFNGHVGGYAGEREDAYLVRGGNQSDSVTDAWVHKDRLLGARWPISVPMFGKAVVVASGGSTGGKEA